MRTIVAMMCMVTTVSPLELVANQLFAQTPSSKSWNADDLVKEAHALSRATATDVQRKADAGDPRAQFLIGLVYEQGYAGFSRDRAIALRWFERAADSRVGLAEKFVGDYYLRFSSDASRSGET